MFPLQNAGSVAVIAPASTATNATASGVIDTMGYEEVKVCVLLDSAASTSNNPVTLSLTESDDATTYVAIAAFTGDATDGFTIPNADSVNPQVVELNVDARARKRYLKVTVTPGTAAQIVGAVAVLGKAKDSTVAGAEAAESVTA
jgi:hypothetical protein